MMNRLLITILIALSIYLINGAILPISDGGTNSGSALLGSRLMCSSAGKIVGCGSSITIGSLESIMMTSVVGLILPTSGGTPSLLDYYEELSLAVTVTGAFSTTTSIKARRLGNIVTIVFPAMLNTATTATYLRINFSFSPSSLYPSPESIWYSFVKDSSVGLGTIKWVDAYSAFDIAPTSGAFTTGASRGYDKDITISFVKY
jgi:hypothetical protein